MLLYGHEMRISTEDDLSMKVKFNEVTQIKLDEFVKKLKHVKKQLYTTLKLVKI